MKKTLVAMAALSALSAMAQSTVTMYGNLDYSYTLSPEKRVTSGTTITGADAATVTTKTTALRAVGANRNFSSNLLGFRGSEDLGKGLKANFQIETAITGNQGEGSATTATTLFSNAGANSARDTWLGLSGGFGEVRIGHQSTHEFANNGLAEAGSANLIQNINGFAGFGRQARHDMISFITPNMNGLTGTIQYGKAGVKADSSAVVQTTDTTRSHMNLGLNYAKGPLTLAAGTRTAKTTADGTSTATAANVPNAGVSIDVNGLPVGLIAATTTTASAATTYNADAKSKANYLFANYDLGVAKVFAGYVTHKTTFAGDVGGVVLGGLTNKSKATNVGVQVPMGAFVPFFSVARGKQDERVTSTGIDSGWGNDKYKSMSFGTTYAMSKRTGLYAVYNKLTIDTTYDGTAVNALRVDKDKRTQALVGIRHSF